MSMVRTKADEDRISDLHFLMSNADRRRIIAELQNQPLKLNEVAKKLDITPTEAFRQLQKLTDACLLEKIVDGRYRSSPYSSLILEHSASLEFLSRHREYFLDHDLSLIPPQFRARIGELSKTVLFPEAVPNINTATEVLKSAEERIDVMAEQRLEQHGHLLRQRGREGVTLRFLLQDSMIETIKIERKTADPVGETRFIPMICAMIIRTDKSVGIAFPKLDGKMDYQAFAGTDPESMKWADDLFEDQWNRARPWQP
jgi:predicted transcriptional regulator